jgi:hypothetical protein
MRRVLAAIGRALAAIPRLVWRVIEVGGRTVLSLVAAPATPADGPGFHDDLAQAAEEARLFSEPCRCVETVVRGYAHAIRLGGPDRPTLRGLPEPVQRWAASLTRREALAICKTRAVDRQISKHVNARSDAELIVGVRRLNGTWPPQVPTARIAAPVDESETVSAQHDPVMDEFFRDALADIDMHETGYKISDHRKAA